MTLDGTGVGRGPGTPGFAGVDVGPGVGVNTVADGVNPVVGYVTGC